ncbi:hypothetical protein AS594_39475 [Streptomyces agglomeratus]|uniref:Uncharacterized protein n=2 Tax=Streptomyces agglomeratus TaxID=285458 RepID=A0A1E5NZJ9_9ACTN|nr:hypothetical protein AS594_39475 [Streptomyces agglomeratus]
MDIRTQEDQHEGPAPSRSKYSPSVQILGYVVGTIGFTLLALSGERPDWLRAAYAIAALTFAVGAAATAVKHFRERRRGGSTVR